MKKGIILGNGINNRIGINSFSTEEIRKRFIENIRRYMPLFEASFDNCFNDTEIVGEIRASSNWGIEILAGIVYEYVSKQIGDRWSENDDIRLQDLLTCIAITTIFLDYKGKRKVEYEEDKLPDFGNYDSIFTLNYFEFWDKKNVAKPLHGHIDLNRINDDTNMLVSISRMNYEKYSSTVDELKKCNRVQIVNLDDIIFAPSSVDKNHLICVAGVFPSSRLYSAKDLFLFDPKNLYEELNDIDEIHIFGMSPEGDESLINKINTRKKIRVFVHNLKTNKETEKWENKLTGNYDFMDSSMI